MTTLHITRLPGPDERVRVAALQAIRDALRILHDDASLTAEQALTVISGRSLPILLGVTDSQTAIEAARSLLEAQGFQIGVDLPPEELSGLRTPQNEPAAPDADPSPTDDETARVALVMMQAADGSPLSAISLMATLANAVEDPSIFMDAGAFLIETFRMDLQQETIAAMAEIAGLEEDER